MMNAERAKTARNSSLIVHIVQHSAFSIHHSAFIIHNSSFTLYTCHCSSAPGLRLGGGHFLLGRPVPRHHLPELDADLFDHMLGGLGAHLEEPLPSLGVLVHPLAR